MDEKVRCPYCNREHVVKRGFRRLKRCKKRIYFCNDCFHRFSFGLERKRFDIKVILNAVYAYNESRIPKKLNNTKRNNIRKLYVLCKPNIQGYKHNRRRLLHGKKQNILHTINNPKTIDRNLGLGFQNSVAIHTVFFNKEQV